MFEPVSIGMSSQRSKSLILRLLAGKKLRRALGSNPRAVGSLGVIRRGAWESYMAAICFPLWVSSTEHFIGDFRAIVVGLHTLFMGNKLHNSHFQVLWVNIVRYIEEINVCIKMCL